ncbi:hypothetical protein HY492_03405 [Candidatus Woesearchaeota archaeon]|nr:hypothetical protein [Candidatus Woesearchaeota archaeon]
MDKQAFKTALDFLKSSSEKKKFIQGVDLVINLKNLDLKQNDQQVDLFIQLPHGRGKKNKIACLCGPELAANAKQNCDLTITTDQFSQYDKKQIKKIASEYDFFIAQANIMPEVAKVFGRILGPRNKMPNPKAGAVVPPSANIKALVEKFAKTVRIMAKSQMSTKALIAKENQPENEVLDNAFFIYESLKKSLPQEDNNIKSILLKYTMSKPIPIGMAPEDIKKLWEEGAARAEASRKQRIEKLAQAAEKASHRKKTEDAPKKKAKAEEEVKKAKAEEEVIDPNAPKKPVEKKEVWETDLDKPRAPRKPRRYGEGTDRPRGGHKDKGARR